MDKVTQTLTRTAVQSLMIARSTTPYRSGTLSRAWKLTMLPNGFELTNDTPYLPYVNEKWLSPRWRGRANPNEMFVEETTKLITQFISNQLGGTYVSNG